MAQPIEMGLESPCFSNRFVLLLRRPEKRLID